MKKLCFILLNCITFLSCGPSYPKAENAMDAAREFIDGCQKGDFDKADFYMLKDDQNEQQFQKLKDSYSKKSVADKEQYKEASINILEEDTINDTTHIINYKNSFDNIVRKAKVVQHDGIWQVDLKYTFGGNL